MLIGVAIGILMYAFLQYREDTRAQREGKPLASTAKRVGLFAIVILVCTVLAYFLETMNLTGTSLIRGGDGESGAIQRALQDHRAHAQMLSRIKEEVLVGLPPF